MLEDLEAGNAVRSSPIRTELVETLTDLIGQLDNSMTDENGAAVDRVAGAIKTYDDLRGSFQDMAEIEWTELYAHFLDQLNELVGSSDPLRPTPGLLTPQVAIATRWRARTRKAPGTPIPPEVVGRFVFLLRWQVEARLGQELRRIQQLSRLRVLNGDDIPSLARLASGFSMAADRAISEYQAQQRTKRPEGPGGGGAGSPCLGLERRGL